MLVLINGRKYLRRHDCEHNIFFKHKENSNKYIKYRCKKQKPFLYENRKKSLNDGFWNTR